MVTIHENYYGFDHVCGGSIINEYWVLTAAHCIDYPNKPSKYEILVGLHRLSKTSHKRAKRYTISKIVVHEDYNPVAIQNDIALLRTLKAIDLHGSRGYVNGVCLPETNKDPTGWATVTGWGHTLEGGENSDILKVVNVPLIPRDLCKRAYEKEPEADEITEGMICAGTANRDSCQSDSGGPLVQKNKKGFYTQIGVVSFGNGCGNRFYPGVYTKVAAYMEWMDSHMNEHA